MSYQRKRPTGCTVHPGEILRAEFLEPLRITPYALAKAVRVPVPRINDIVLQKRGITPDTAMRLGHYFGISPEFWMNLQTSFVLAVARKHVSRELPKIKPLQMSGD